MRQALVRRYTGVSAVYLARERQLALLLLVHLVMILTGTLTFTFEPSLRYLQPVSVLYIPGIALCLRAFLNGESPEEAAVP